MIQIKEDYLIIENDGNDLEVFIEDGVLEIIVTENYQLPNNKRLTLEELRELSDFLLKQLEKYDTRMGGGKS